MPEIYIPLPKCTYFTDFEAEGSSLQSATLPQLRHLEVHPEWLRVYEDLFPPSPQPVVQPTAPHDLVTSSEQKVDGPALPSRVLRLRTAVRRPHCPRQSSSSSSDESVHFQEVTDEVHSKKSISSSEQGLTLCTACGSFVTSYSKELFNNCSQQFVHTHRNRNEAA